MISANMFASDKFKYKEGLSGKSWTDYDKLAEQFWREQQEKAAKKAKAEKQTKEDKAAAKEMSEAGAKTTKTAVPKAEPV